jgi:RHS repeat-associated protein
MELNASQGVYNRARYTYDERDLLQKIEHFDDGTTNFQTRSFTYDGYGRLASQTTPEAGTVSYQYSLDDQVTRMTDARGMYVDYVYNPRNLVTNVNYSEASTPDVTYSYGDYGERTMMRESLPSGTIGQTNYEYDPYKRLKKETRTFQDLPGKSYSVEYEYNFVDALKKIKYNMNGWQKEVNYSYNYTGAPTTIGTNLVSIGGLTTSNNILRDLNYRSFGAVKNVNYGNGRRMEATYDSNRMSLYQMVIKSQAGAGVIVNQTYDYHQGGANNGRIQKITDNWDGTYSATYTYDDYNRLASVSSPSHSRSFSYDQWGNLTQTTASGGGETGSYGMSYSTVNGAPTNRLDHQGYGYDDAGNMTSDGWGTYTFDGAGRLRTFGGAGNAWEYDGDGRKVKSISGGYPLYFVWSSLLNQPAAEVTNGGVYRAYVYDQGGRQVAQQSSDGLFYWLHTDHLGSGRKVTDVSGNVVYRGEFDAHGQTLLETGSVWTISNKFTGYERNWATHIDYAKARGYNRYRNRFLSPDPLGIGAADPSNPQSLNRYSYVGNDPINNVDPSGLMACYIDGIECSCDMAFGMLESGAGVIGPADSTRWNPGLNGGKGG